MNIAIAGAGLVGRFVALLLHQVEQQLRQSSDTSDFVPLTITLFEKGTLANSHQTAKVAAAMVAPIAESVHCPDDVTLLGHASLSLWPRLLKWLDCEPHFHQQGSLLLAFQQDQPELRRFLDQVEPDLRSSITYLTPNKLCQLEPELVTKFSGGWWLESEGHIDNVQLIQELDSKLLKSKVNIVENTDVDPKSLTKDNKYDLVIDCRGVGAKCLESNPLKSLRGVRGEVIRVHAPEVTLTRPVRLMHPRYALYIVPKPHQRYVIGATEIESESSAPITIRSTLELLSAAYSVHSGFAEAQIEQSSIGLRPALIDNKPVIFEQQNVIYVNGLYRHGYLLLPAILKNAWSVIAPKLGLPINCPF